MSANSVNTENGKSERDPLPRTKQMAVILSYTDLEGKLWLLCEKDKASVFPTYPGVGSEETRVALVRAHTGAAGGLLANREKEVNLAPTYPITEADNVIYYNVHLGNKSHIKGNSPKSEIERLKESVAEADKYKFVEATKHSHHNAVRALTKFAPHHKLDLDQPVIIATIGNGNCPFNATFLNWLVQYRADDAVKAHLDSDVFQPFIAEFAKHLPRDHKATTWKEILALPVKVSEKTGGKALRAVLANMLKSGGVKQRYREMLRANIDNVYEVCLKGGTLPSQDQFQNSPIADKISELQSQISEEETESIKALQTKIEKETSGLDKLIESSNDETKEVAERETIQKRTAELQVTLEKEKTELDKLTKKKEFDEWVNETGFDEYIKFVSDGEAKKYVSAVEAGLVNEHFHFNTRVSTPNSRGLICRDERLDWPTVSIRHTGDIHYEAYMPSEMVEKFNKSREADDCLAAQVKNKDEGKPSPVVLDNFSSAEHFEKMGAVYSKKKWIKKDSAIKAEKDHEKIRKLRTVDESGKYTGEVELTIKQISTGGPKTKEGNLPRGQLHIMPRYIPENEKEPLSDEDKNAFELQQAARVAIANFKALAEKNGNNINDLAIHIKDIGQWDEQAVLNAFKAAEENGTKFQRIYINGKLRSGTPLTKKPLTTDTEEPEQQPTTAQAVTRAVFNPFLNKYGATLLTLLAVGGGLATTYHFDDPNIPGIDPVTPETLLRFSSGLPLIVAPFALNALLIGGKKLASVTLRTLTKASPLIMALAKTPSATDLVSGLAALTARCSGLVSTTGAWKMFSVLSVLGRFSKATMEFGKIISNYNTDTRSQRLRRAITFSNYLITTLGTMYIADSYVGSSLKSVCGETRVGSLAPLVIQLLLTTGIKLPRLFAKEEEDKEKTVAGKEKTGIEWLVEKTPLQKAGWGDVAKNTLEVARTFLMAGAFLPMTWVKAGMGLLTLSYAARSAETVAEEGTKQLVRAAAEKVTEKGAEHFVKAAEKVAEKTVIMSAGKAADKLIKAAVKTGGKVAEKFMETSAEESAKRFANVAATQCSSLKNASETFVRSVHNNTHLLFSRRGTTFTDRADFSDAPAFFTKPLMDLTNVSTPEAVKNVLGSSGWGPAAGFAVLGTSVLYFVVPGVLMLAGMA